jgi:4-cresol dehydrogenase (hydroxylating) flavoprotein subunit
VIATVDFESEVIDLIDRGPMPRKDLSGHTCRPIGVLKPRNRDDVVRLVKAARRYRIKLHAVSCGRNWGFGSSLPRKSPTWIVNLAHLDRISDYDRETGSITIGPGITQIALYRELSRLGGEWFFNVTGAGHSTSVLGNSLERGIGYYGQRQLDLIELEVVTGKGDLITTRPATHGAATLGLDLTQLFVQSAFGIVVGARLRLLPRTNGGGAAIVRLKEPDRFPDVLKAILRLKLDGAIAGVPHIANRERIYTTLAPWTSTEDRALLAERTASWTAAIPVAGCREITEAAFKLIRIRLQDYCEVETIFAARDSASDGGSAMEQLHLLISGYPSNLALAGVEWTALGTANPKQSDPEATGAGLIHVTPATRSSTEEILRVISAIEQNASRLDLESLPMTVNVVDQLTTVIIVSIGFPANAAKRFKDKARKLEARLFEMGVTPYRIGLGQEEWIPMASNEARVLYRKLRSVFDPSRVFAASKYEATYRIFRPEPQRPSLIRRPLMQEESA